MLKHRSIEGAVICKVASIDTLYKNLLRHLISLAFGEKVISIRGECGQPFWFRPSEYPSLLRGIHAFERRYFQGWKGLLQRDERIADIGANIGLTVQRFYSLTQGQCRIFAFEPSARNLSLLKRNVQELGADEIRIMEYAVSDSNGVAQFSENLGHGGLSRMAILDSSKTKDAQLWRHQQQLSVKTVTLDNFFLNSKERLGHPTLIKIDVEGAGGMVLRGARRLLELHKPALCCSFHGREEIESMSQVVATHGYGALSFTEDSSWKWCESSKSDGYFVHPSDPRLGRMCL